MFKYYGEGNISIIVLEQKHNQKNEKQQEIYFHFICSVKVLIDRYSHTSECQVSAQ